jgi:toluene monooxygenase system protein D
MSARAPHMSARVGPVLEAGEGTLAIIAAIRQQNRDVVVHDRGSYLRVLVPGRCVVTRQAVERALGRPFRLPGDLELLMPSFKGVFSVSEEEAVWAFDRS